MNASNCLKCGHPRPTNTLECPHCGVIYHKAEAAARKAEKQGKKVALEKSKSANAADNDNGSIHPCPHCNRPVPKKSKACPYCGYDRRCVGCNRLVPKEETICSLCGFKIPTPKQYKEILFLVTFPIVYFFLSFLFHIKRPYFTEFNGEYYYSFTHLMLPLALVSVWITFRSCQLLFPPRFIIIAMLFAASTFMLTFGSANYAAAFNFFVGEQQTMALQGRIEKKKICGGRSKSHTVEIKTPQLSRNLKLRVPKRYYQAVKVGATFRQTIHIGSLGIVYVDRKK